MHVVGHYYVSANAPTMPLFASGKLAADDLKCGITRQDCSAIRDASGDEEDRIRDGYRFKTSQSLVIHPSFPL
jgi:hypothetical protein